MKIQLTKQECLWLADLAKKEKERAATTNQEMPSQIFELRRDNMADLESKLNTADQKEIHKERNHAR